MIQIFVGMCLRCGFKICRRCGGCHCEACDERLSFCRCRLLSDEKHAGRRHRQVKQGVQRRLRRKIRIA